MNPCLLGEGTAWQIMAGWAGSWGHWWICVDGHEPTVVMMGKTLFIIPLSEIAPGLSAFRTVRSCENFTSPIFYEFLKPVNLQKRDFPLRSCDTQGCDKYPTWHADMHIGFISVDVLWKVFKSSADAPMTGGIFFLWKVQLGIVLEDYCIEGAGACISANPLPLCIPGRQTAECPYSPWLVIGPIYTKHLMIGDVKSTEP